MPTAMKVKPQPSLAFLPRANPRHRRCHLQRPQHPARDQPIPHPVQRLPPLLISAPGGSDLFWVWPPSDRASQQLDGSPLAARIHPFGANHNGCRSLTMLVVLGFHDDAVRYDTCHPVRGQSGPRQLGHLDRHGDTAEAVEHTCDGGGDHLSVGGGCSCRWLWCLRPLSPVRMQPRAGSLLPGLASRPAPALSTAPPHGLCYPKRYPKRSNKKTRRSEFSVSNSSFRDFWLRR